MEFIPQSIFDSQIGEAFLVGVIYMSQFRDAALSYGFLDIPQPPQLNPCINYPDTIYTYVKTMVYGGSISFKIPVKKTIVEDVVDPNTGEVIDKELRDLDPIQHPEDLNEFSDLLTDIEVESDGKLAEDYKKKIGKLNEKLTNLQDSLTSIIASASSYVTAVAIPFSMAAGIAGIMSTIGQLKGLKNIIGEVNEILEECNLSAANLDSLVPGVGTTITTVLDLIEGTVTVLTAIIPV